jgi:hypothetical protein
MSTKKDDSVYNNSGRKPAIETFDLLEFQQYARQLCCPKKLFELWEDVCQRYERREIGMYELEEMKEVIWPTLMALAIIRRTVNGITDKRKQSKRRSKYN